MPRHPATYLKLLHGLAALLLAALVGCGGATGGGPISTSHSTGSSTSNTSATGGTGSVAVAVTWPAATSRLIPEASNSLTVEVLTSSGASLSPAVTATINRPDTTTTLTGVSAGNRILKAVAYPETNGQGTAQAAGQTAFTLNDGQTVTVPLTMNSTISSVTVSPSSASLTVGATQQLTATAKDGDGNTVLVAGAGFDWSITSGSGYILLSSSGLVTAQLEGSATVRATESESGVSGTASVTVKSGSVPSASDYVVVDTAQTACYNNSNSISAPSEGSSFYGQDAQFDGAQPSYRDNGDGTVSDLTTGLMWVQDAGDKVNYDTAHNGASTCRVGGYSDWRLPTIKELYSLMDFRGTDPSSMNDSASTLTPFIDTDYFVFDYGDTAAGERIIDAQYWSATDYLSTTMGGNYTTFGVNFADGRIKGYPGKLNNHSMFVRYVRGNTSYGLNSFVDNGDGTITDSATGLMWQQDDSGSGLNWQSALAYAQKKNDENYLGYSDWRLPNAKELQSLIDYSRCPDATNSAAIDPLFSATSITNEAGQTDWACYWTSTTHVKSNGMGDSAAYVAFGRALGYWNGSWQDVHGAGAQRSDPKTGDPSDYPTGHGPQGDAVRIYNYVRLVRGGTD